MKGTHIYQGKEFQVNIEGEKWNQGDRIRGHFQAKFESGSLADLQEPGVMLAYIPSKRIKRGSLADQLTIMECKTFSAEELADFKKCTWDFYLGTEMLITEKAGSLFLLFGETTDIENMGKLQIVIDPHPLLEGLLEIMRTFFRFKPKEWKNKEGSITCKLVPPDGRDFSTMKVLDLIGVVKETGAGDSSHEEGRPRPGRSHGKEKFLHLKFLFTVNGLQHDTISTKLTQAQKEYSLVLSPKDYLTFGTALNQDRLISEITQILEQVRPKLLF
jgi:hypothetical protein